MTALALACLALLIPSTALADWSSDQVVSGVGSSTSQTKIAGGLDGSAWVIWKRDVGGFQVIQGTKVAPDGTQGPIVPISATNMDATDPVIAARSDGSAMVAWINQSATADTVYSMSIASDGTMGGIMPRSEVGPVGQPAKNISIAVGEDGTSALVWQKFDGANWVAQVLKVGADGSSGTIENLSDPATQGTAGIPAIAVMPPNANSKPGDQYVYAAVWTAGTGAAGNIYGRQINVDGTLTDSFQTLWPYVNPNFPAPGQPDGIGTGGDPRSLQLAYGRNGALDIMWIRHRADWHVNGVRDNSFDSRQDPPVRDRPEDDPDDTQYFHDAIEQIRLDPDVPLPSAGTLPLLKTVTPVVEGEPYEVSQLTLTERRNSTPVIAYVHDLDGGGYDVVINQILRNSLFQEWTDPAGTLSSDPGKPVVAGNRNGVGLLGWSSPAGLPGQVNSQWARFSNSSVSAPFSPSDVYSQDQGFVVGASGTTVAAYTGIDGSLAGSSKVVTFARPGISVSPSRLNYGNVRIGNKSTLYITIRSTGETPNTVTGIGLSGADTSQFTLSGSDACLKSIGSGDSCQFGVTFKPDSVGTRTATVTVSSPAGTLTTDLTGSGLDQTRNVLTATPRNSAVRKGQTARIKVTAANVGGTASSSTKVCVQLNKRALRLAGSRCHAIGSLPAGESRTFTYKVRVTSRAHKGRKLPVTFRLTSGNAVVRQAVVNVRRKK